MFEEAKEQHPSERSDTDSSNDSLESQIEQFYQQQRQRSLEQRLDRIAEEIEQMMLQAVIARELFGRKVTVPDEVKNAIQRLRAAVSAQEFERVEAEIDDVEEDIKETLDSIREKISTVKLRTTNRVESLRQLNEELEIIQQEEIESLHEVLSNWAWEDEVANTRTEEYHQLSFLDRKEAVKEWAQAQYATLEDIRESLYGAYEETPLDDVAGRLLNDEDLTMDDLKQSEWEELMNSKLASYIQLKMG